MKFLIDANLSPRVARQLAESGHVAVHVGDVGLGSADDDTFLQRAGEADEVLILGPPDPGSTGGAHHPGQALVRTAGDLDGGAIASITPGRIRVRSLPVSDGPT